VRGRRQQLVHDMYPSEEWRTAIWADVGDPRRSRAASVRRFVGRVYRIGRSRNFAHADDLNDPLVAVTLDHPDLTGVRCSTPKLAEDESVALDPAAWMSAWSVLPWFAELHGASPRAPRSARLRCPSPEATAGKTAHNESSPAKRPQTLSLLLARAQVQPRAVAASSIDAAVPDDDVLDIGGVVRLLHVGRNKVYDLVARNEIPHRRLGKQIRFSRAAIMRWLDPWSSQDAKERQ